MLTNRGGIQRESRFSATFPGFYLSPATPQTIWIDQQMHKDTIITNVDNQNTVLYYAAYQWQQAADTGLSHGYCFIAIFHGDSIFVKQLNNTSTTYDGPFLLQTNKGYDTLKAQNFLDTSIAIPQGLIIHLSKPRKKLNQVCFRCQTPIRTILFLRKYKDDHTSYSKSRFRTFRACKWYSGADDQLDRLLTYFGYSGNNRI